MDGGLARGDERPQPVEHGVDVRGIGVQGEDPVEVDTACDLGVRSGELAEVELLVPGAHRVALDEPVGDVAGAARSPPAPTAAAG